jgi:hypothetical protein
LYVKHAPEIRKVAAGVLVLGVLVGLAIVLSPLSPGTHEYRNYPYRFALTLPTALTATELPAGAADTETILFQNNAADGVQLMIWPYDEPQGITPVDIEQTGLTISDAVPLTFTGVPGYEATGYTFKSNNDAFGGASSDAWFVYRGSLYQFSTYTRDDALLKRLLASWTFF